MMKVLHLGKYYPPEPGGIEYFLKNLLAATRQYFENHAIVADKGQIHREESETGITVYHRSQIGTLFLTPILPGLFGFLHKLRKKHEFGCIVLHAPNPMTTAALAVTDFISPLREKLVIFYHGDILVDSPLQKIAYFFFRHLEDRVFFRADRFIAHSPNLVRHSQVLGRYQGMVDIVPSTVPDDWPAVTAEDEQEASRIRKEAGKPIVLFVGRLVPYKGLDTLVASAKMVRDAVFILVGDGPLEGDLKRRAAEQGVSDRFVFAGRVGRLKPYYLACDVFVLPSNSPVEAFGLVLVEAMSFGKPVVTSDLPTGVTYVNDDGKTGFTFPVRDSIRLAEVMNRLLSDEPLRNRLGKNARERVEREFASAVVGRKFAEAIENVCKGGHTR